MIRRPFIFLLIFLGFISCKTEKVDSRIQNRVENIEEPSPILHHEFDSILLEHHTKGVIVFKKEHMLHINDAYPLLEKGKLPASTFKIPNTLIGLQSGTITNEHVFPYNGEKRYLKMWEQDLELKRAFQMSCLPCYQEMTRMVGYRSMKEQVESFAYGELVFDENNYDSFWVEGESKISPMQQINFLERLKNRDLVFDLDHMDTVIDFIETGEQDGWKIYGKTGMSITDGKRNGWYVGWAEKGDKTIYFAANLEPLDQNHPGNFIENRKKSTLAALPFMLED